MAFEYIYFLLIKKIYLYISFWLCQVLIVVHQLNSCPAARGISDPQPDIKPMFPALQGRFLTTGPPENILEYIFNILEYIFNLHFFYCE